MMVMQPFEPSDSLPNSEGFSGQGGRHPARPTLSSDLNGSSQAWHSDASRPRPSQPSLGGPLRPSSSVNGETRWSNMSVSGLPAPDEQRRHDAISSAGFPGPLSSSATSLSFPSRTPGSAGPSYDRGSAPLYGGGGQQLPDFAQPSRRPGGAGGQPLTSPFMDSSSSAVSTSYGRFSSNEAFGVSSVPPTMAAAGTGFMPSPAQSTFHESPQYSSQSWRHSDGPTPSSASMLSPLIDGQQQPPLSASGFATPVAGGSSSALPFGHRPRTTGPIDGQNRRSFDWPGQLPLSDPSRSGGWPSHADQSPRWAKSPTGHSFDAASSSASESAMGPMRSGGPRSAGTESLHSPTARSGKDSEGSTTRKSKKRAIRPQTCSYPGCGAVLSSRAHARRHERIHFSDARYCCPHEGCTSSFSRKDSCAYHQKGRHGSILPPKVVHVSDEPASQWGLPGPALSHGMPAYAPGPFDHGHGAGPSIHTHPSFRFSGA